MQVRRGSSGRHGAWYLEELIEAHRQIPSLGFSWESQTDSGGVSVATPFEIAGFGQWCMLLPRYWGCILSLLLIV
ncbi:MAG: hypothetical protein ACPG77_19710, partial [Nannocystaceae bacterium]